MTRARTLDHIGILAHVGNTNLGDEAIVAAVIQNIRELLPAANIRGFTGNPEDTQRRHGILAYPLRRPSPRAAGGPEGRQPEGMQEPIGVLERTKAALKRSPGVYRLLKSIELALTAIRHIPSELGFLWRSYGRMRGTQLLVIAGSQQMNDYFGGAWGYPYTLLKWTVMARLTGARVALLSVGAGPLRFPLGKRFVRAALGLMEYRSYRGQSTKDFLRELNVPTADSVAPDLAFSLAVPDALPDRVAITSRPIVGLNPVPYCDARYWPETDPVAYAQYVDKLASFAHWLIARGYAVLLFPTQLRADPLVIRDIRAAMQPGPDTSGALLEREIDSVESLLAVISTTQFVVASRFHGIVLPFMLHKPLLGLAYHSKAADLMAELGQTDFLVDIRTFSVEVLQERFLSLESRSEAIQAELARQTTRLRHALDVQYKQVLRLEGGR